MVPPSLCIASVKKKAFLYNGIELWYNWERTYEPTKRIKLAFPAGKRGVCE